jgi:hypothetical protein
MDMLDIWFTRLTNIGVIVGLVVLVYEVNQNTQALQNETDVAIYTMAVDNRQMLLEHSKLRELYVRSVTENWQDFTPDEQMMLLAYWSAETDRMELQFILFKRNETDLDNIVFYERDLLLEPFVTGWNTWKGSYDPEFVEYLDGLIEKAN